MTDGGNPHPTSIDRCVQAMDDIFRLPLRSLDLCANAKNDDLFPRMMLEDRCVQVTHNAGSPSLKPTYCWV